MKFFSKEQKDLALKTSSDSLFRLYLMSEKKLVQAASQGNIDELKEHMERHRLFEYARLYQFTPEYKQIKQKEKRK